MADKGDDSRLTRQKAMVMQAAEEVMGLSLDQPSADVSVDPSVDLSVDSTKVSGGRRPTDVPLVKAAQQGDTGAVRDLLDACYAPLDSRADVTEDDMNCRDVTALWAAAANGHLDLVKDLIARGASVGLTTRSQSGPLWSASFNGHLPVVRLLLEHGAARDVNATDHDGCSMLMMVCEKGHTAIAKELLKCGADIDSTDNDGDSVLMMACHRGQKDVVRVLLDKQVDVNYTNADGASALTIACDSGRADIVRVLLDEGRVDVNCTECDGKSGLMNACYRGRKDMASLLLERGTDVLHSTPDAGLTALHFAAQEGVVHMCKLLLARGASVTHDKQGLTPLMTAAVEGHESLTAYLADLSDVSREDKVNALELLGTTLWLDDCLEPPAGYSHLDRCLALWQRAMEERYRPGQPELRKVQAEKVAVCGHATEVASPEELGRLQQRDDPCELGVQCMLVRERLLGKGHSATANIINRNASLHAAEDRFSRSVELMIHSIDNLSALCPFTSQLPWQYAVLIKIINYDQNVEELESVSDSDNEDLGGPQLSFGQIVTVLKRVTSDISRGEVAELVPDDQSEKFVTGRDNLLKIVLHICCLLHRAAARATPQEQERQEFCAVMTNFVQKDGPRGAYGDTLLHMACQHSTEAVKVLLQAGCDVTAHNEAEQTALEVLLEQKGDHSQIVGILTSAS